MGHPPVSPSAPAPAGTTAIPGLIPDLVAGTPSWPLPQGPAGLSLPAPLPRASSSSPASSVLPAAAAAATGRSPGTRSPWVWAVPAAPPPPTWCNLMWMAWSPARGMLSNGGACSSPWSSTLEARRSGWA
ncbi:synaptotagmin 8 [Homo sapiens]|uniref:Synaptotagmin 8 n=1 Tax=Homo sapiens TaxID=9606 RepID=F8WBL4_HUMAN|nr:synaptotagmin 8 [Homo sapiens]KAI4069398.1 synaptotagmin 8 [Homo sapiens]